MRKDDGGKAKRRRDSKLIERVMAELELYEANGAGFPVDQMLREFHGTANERLLQYGRDGLPNSFIVMERFCTRDSDPEWHPLRSERDHLFVLNDFLMFAASDAAPKDIKDAAMLMPEGVIHTYTPVGPWDRTTTFRDNDDQRMALCGVSFVRRGAEVAIAALGGPVCDLDAETQRLRAFYDNPDMEMKSFNPAVNPAKPSPNRYSAVPVAGTTNIWRHPLLMIVNTERRRINVRYLYADEGCSYRIYSDDPEAFPGTPDPDDLPPAITESLKMLESRSTYIDLCVYLLKLPAYFAYRRDMVREEPTQTDLSKKRADGSLRKAIEKASPRPKVLVRRVAALREVRGVEPTVSAGADEDRRRYTPPAYRVELDGFWRRLKYADHFGKGPDGEPVQGATWVKAHQRWKDRPESPGRTILFKTPLDAADASMLDAMGATPSVH